MKNGLSAPADVTFELAQHGVRASRDQVTLVGDQVFGRRAQDYGRRRLYTRQQVDDLVVLLAVTQGTPNTNRSMVLELMDDPSVVIEPLQEKAREAQGRVEDARAAIEKYWATENLDARVVAMKRIAALAATT